jgi:hypothetical protein
MRVDVHFGDTAKQAPGEELAASHPLGRIARETIEGTS